MLFNIDFKKLAQRLAPFYPTTFLAFIQTVTNQLRIANAALVSLVSSKTTELSYNAQVMVLEAALNATFAPGDIMHPPGGIYITDGLERGAAEFTFYAHEGQPADGFTYYADEAHGDDGFSYYASELAGTIHFTVNVPADLGWSAAEIQVFVDKYKGVSKNNNIIFY